MGRARTIVVLAASLAALSLCGCSHATSASTTRSALPTPPTPPQAAQAFAVGEGGAILATSDGVHWKAERSGTHRLLGAIAFADPQHGWAVGERGTILATTDGGLSWQAQHEDVSSGTLSGVAAVDSQHAWAVGQDDKFRPVILATSDGGSTWSQQYSNASTDDVSKVAFANSTHGWAVLESGSILATADGRHWHVQWRAAKNGRRWKPGVAFFGLACADATHVWAAGGYGAGEGNALMLATTDGGRSWRVQSSKLPGGFLSVAASDTTHAWTTEAHQ